MMDQQIREQLIEVISKAFAADVVETMRADPRDLAEKAVEALNPVQVGWQGCPAIGDERLWHMDEAEPMADWQPVFTLAIKER